MDTLSPIARDLVPVLLKATAARKAMDPVEEEAIGLLESWDFRMSEESAGAAVFAVIYQSLLDELFRERLGEDCFKGFTAYGPLAARTVRKVFLQGKTAWLGGVKPEAVLVKATEKGMQRGLASMGDNPEEWKWGQIHTTVFRHPLTARSRFLEMLYHVGPISMPGSADSINYAGWSAIHPFEVLGGVSLRQIAEMTHPPELTGISPMGSSAHFFSIHYKDQTPAWAKGRSFREPVVRADIRQSGFNAVLFRPGQKRKISRK
jgi:penicillin amidase